MTKADWNCRLFLVRFIRRADVLRQLSQGSACVLIERPTLRTGSQCLLYTAIGYVAQPRLSNNGEGYLVRAELPKTSGEPNVLLLSGAAIRQYFYALDGTPANNLYALLGVSENVTPSDLRMAWRVRQLEAGVRSERASAERAFNLLAHPDLRNCYDALRRDENAPPAFPYGGFGSILVEGRLSTDGEVFFADRIVGYKPEMSSRRVSLLLRQCDFLADRVL
jgi:hypothetical protein